MPLDGVGENGRIYENIHETFAPWDNPDQLIEFAENQSSGQHKLQEGFQIEILIG